jgi:hypothetical protein
LSSLARLGFLLIAVQALLGSGRSLIAILQEVRVLGVEEPSSYFFYTGIAWLAFSFTPPAVLLLLRVRLAAFLFPPDPPESAPPSPAAILTTGTAILGLYLGAIGLSGVLGSGLMGFLTISRNETFALGWFGRVGESLFLAALGVSLFVYSRPLIGWLGSRWRAA